MISFLMRMVAGEPSIIIKIGRIGTRNETSETDDSGSFSPEDTRLKDSGKTHTDADPLLPASGILAGIYSSMLRR